MNEIYPEFPDELKNVIIDTRVVAGYGEKDSSNFVSNEKLYLFAPVEMLDHNYSTDSAFSRKLDFYSTLRSGWSNDENVRCETNGKVTSTRWWWLRSAVKGDSSRFYIINNSGSVSQSNGISCMTGIICCSQSLGGISPAFRIG